MTASFGSMCFLPQLNGSVALSLLWGNGMTKSIARLKAVCKTNKACQNMSKHKSWPRFKLIIACLRFCRPQKDWQPLIEAMPGSQYLAGTLTRSIAPGHATVFFVSASRKWSQAIQVLELDWVKSVVPCPTRASLANNFQAFITFTKSWNLGV